MKIKKNKYLKPLISIFLLLIFSFNLIGCSNNKIIKIGFIAQLTGPNAELGVQARNGVILAAEEINDSGGINGRKIELIIYDDLGTEEGAIQGVNKLLDENVIAIIGHVTSSQTIHGLKISNEAKKIMISPTASTNSLSGIDDYFFRVVTSNEVQTKIFAQHVYNKRGHENLAVIYDRDNIGYTETYLNSFKSEYEAQGGIITDAIDFSSSEAPDFSQFIDELKNKTPDALLIISNDFDAALIAQTARIKNWNVPLFSSSWAQTDTLIANGGEAVEGMEIEVVYPQNHNSNRYIDFKNKFSSRFGKNPSFSGSFGYEALNVLSKALSETNGKEDGLKSALLSIPEYSGLIDDFSFDEGIKDVIFSCLL